MAFKTGKAPTNITLDIASGKGQKPPPAPLEIWRTALKALGISERDGRQTRHTYAAMGLHAGMNGLPVPANGPQERKDVLRGAR